MLSLVWPGIAWVSSSPGGLGVFEALIKAI
ncbi:hypothetical protein X474_08880 [Dethiosulfatarculus sandiegensis]|uniref:Uncharacterized protein n=1 Tax=Dethiosulfatarculus sandiegensis TaxID=1429043 RepID=A0A0D2HVA7_9BACT|nr:hypothetical protein X474_08880 [Dethiosulfatarculus sandiegensis]